MLGLVYTECQHQRCDDASDTTLIESNGLAQCKRALTISTIFITITFLPVHILSLQDTILQSDTLCCFSEK